MFFRIRLTFLLSVLVCVLLWAWRDVHNRRERNNWDRPLSVAIVLVRMGRIDDAAIDAFHARLKALDTRLSDEAHRYRPDAVHPFVFHFVGPVDVDQPPPKPAGESIVDAAKQSWALWRWTSRVDTAANIDSEAYDSRIYVAARLPASGALMMIEGDSQEGGRIGAVEVELDPSMVDFSLFVAAHELLHTLGASDKYDAEGRTLIPGGLADPSRVPLYPQPFAEVMARNRPVSADVELPPDRLDQLAVGRDTAREIGWTR